MSRTLASQIAKHLGQTVTLQGFLHWKRDLGGIQFALLRDRSGIVQVVVDKRFELPLAESSMRVVGEVVANQGTRGLRSNCPGDRFLRQGQRTKPH